MVRRLLAALGLALTLSACRFGPGQQQPKDGFVMTVASYGQDGTDGSSTYVGIFRNVGAYAERAEFSVTLLPEDGDGPTWTGTGVAEDIAEGETVQVEMGSDTPPPLARVNVVEFTARRG
jgi:hypothetical protein